MRWDGEMWIWQGIDGKKRQTDSKPSNVLRTERHDSSQETNRKNRDHHCVFVLSGSNQAAKSRSKLRLESALNSVSPMLGSKSPRPEPKSRPNAGSRLSFVRGAGGGGGGGWFMADGPELISGDGDGAVIVDVFGVAGAGVPTGGGPCCGPCPGCGCCWPKGCCCCCPLAFAAAFCGDLSRCPFVADPSAASAFWAAPGCFVLVTGDGGGSMPPIDLFWPMRLPGGGPPGMYCMPWRC